MNGRGNYDTNIQRNVSFKKEHIWVSTNEVDEPTAYCTEWSKKEKDKYCILMHVYGI